MLSDNQQVFERAEAATDSFFATARAANVQAEAQMEEELAQVDQLKAQLEPLAEWADQLYNDLPGWGREACAHRWLEGLESLAERIVQRKYWPVSPGRCGDHPGWIIAMMDRLTLAVEHWTTGQIGPLPEDYWVCETLGETSPAKIEAAYCLIELVRGALYGLDEAWQEKVLFWRARSAENPLLERLFWCGGLDDTLHSTCGFLIEKRLKDYLRIIAGDEDVLVDIRGWCNSQMRVTWQSDPQRLLVTQGYLWGWYAHRVGWTEDTLRQKVPWCAGAAIFAQRQLEKAEMQDTLHHWLVDSLIVKTKHCYCRMLNFASGGLQDGKLPIELWSLPVLIMKERF